MLPSLLKARKTDNVQCIKNIFSSVQEDKHRHLISSTEKTKSLYSLGVDFHRCWDETQIPVGLNQEEYPA